MLLIYKAYTLVPVRLTTSAFTGAAILAAYIGCEWLALEQGWTPTGRGLGSTSVHHYGGFGPDGGGSGAGAGARNHSLPERATQKVFPSKAANTTVPSSPPLSIVGYGQPHDANSDSDSAQNIPADSSSSTAIRVVSMNFVVFLFICLLSLFSFFV